MLTTTVAESLNGYKLGVLTSYQGWLYRAI